MEVWGYDAADLIPWKVFLLASKIGGQVIGAMDGETIVGFAMALPGYRNGRPYLHSHMLAVLPAYRNGGVGRRLKLAQREDAIARGFDLMEWTFDPLEIKNAHLNIQRLGAVVRRYVRDLYGESSSPLQGGLPTDRVYAEWWLRSPRVERAIAGKPVVEGPVVERVGVPAAIYEWKASEEHRGTALTVQRHTAQALESAFEQGLTVIGYESSEFGDGSFLLGRWDGPTGPVSEGEETK
jgi:predicted GNAT superfamily acetyltransferase